MSQHLPSLKPRKVLQALRRAGFFVHHVSGSHYVLKHLDHPTRRVHSHFTARILNAELWLSIIEEAGLTANSFMDLL